MRSLIEVSKHPVLGEYKNNLNQLKGKTIGAVFVAEDETDYYEIHFTDGSGARIDVHCDKFCEGAPVARAGIVFLANVKVHTPLPATASDETEVQP